MLRIRRTSGSMALRAFGLAFVLSYVYAMLRLSRQSTGISTSELPSIAPRLQSLVHWRGFVSKPEPLEPQGHSAYLGDDVSEPALENNVLEQEEIPGLPDDMNIKGAEGTKPTWETEPNASTESPIKEVAQSQQSRFREPREYLNLSAVVLSVDKRRCIHSLDLIRSVGVPQVECVKPLDPLGDKVSARIVNALPDTIGRRRYISNMLTFAREWESFGNGSGDPGDWRIFFEDDVILASDVNRSGVLDAIWHGFELAKNEGFLYLGLCPIDASPQRVTWNGFVYNKGHGGRCTHAFAMNRTRSATFWSFLDSPAAYPPAWYSDFRKKEIMGAWPIFGDVRLNSYALHTTVWVLSGPNTHVMPQGIFVQDRNLFPSAIDS